MKAVILAGGKGTRMRELTIDCPKPMLKIHDRNLIEWKIDVLPEEIREVVIVVGYLKEVVMDYFGEEYKGRKITYVNAEPFGTGYVLWKCKDFLDGDFIVLMGDDLYSREAVRNAIENPFSITTKYFEGPHKGVIKKCDNNFFLGIDDASGEGGFVNTGLYSLSKDIFEFDLVKVPGTEEWGLPHTLVEVGKRYPVKVLVTEHWHQVTSPEDLDKEKRELEAFL